MDRLTLIWANASLMLVIAGLLLVLWADDRKLSPIGVWAAAMAVLAGAAVLFALRNAMPEAWAILGGNGLALLSYGLQWSAVRMAGGRRMEARLLLPACLWLLACAVPPFYASFAARVVLASCLIAATDTATLRALWRLPGDLRTIRRLGMLLFGLRALVYAMRACVTLLAPGEAGSVPGIPYSGLRWPLELLIYHVGMIHPAAASLLVLALVKGMTEQALHRAEQQRMLLFRELNHRVKNILATVQAMTLQTARRSEGDLARFTADYGARLQALARAHDLLTRTAWEPVPARDAVEVALEPWLPSGQIAIEGRPQARLEPAPGQILVLALHELATNAAKYGALSRPEGRVSIVLQREEGEAGAALRLTWQEAHGPPIAAPPRRRGFGQKLLEQGLVLQSGGTVELEFPPAGLRCGIRLPLGRRDQAAAAAAAPQAEAIQARPGPADSNSPGIGTGKCSASQHRTLEQIAGGPGGPEA